MLERRSIVAPFVLRMTDDAATDAPGRGGWTCGTSRTAIWRDWGRHLSVEAVDASQSAARKSDSPNLERLSDEQLRERKIEFDDRERFYRFQLVAVRPVEIQGVMRARLTRGMRTVTLAAEIDPRFDADTALANQRRG